MNYTVHRNNASLQVFPNFSHIISQWIVTYVRQKFDETLMSSRIMHGAPGVRYFLLDYLSLYIETKFDYIVVDTFFLFILLFQHIDKNVFRAKNNYVFFSESDR